MRSLALGFLLLAACARPAAPERTEFWQEGRSPDSLPMPKNEPGRVSSRNVEQLASGIDALAPAIGRHPPRIANQAERADLYARWSDLVRDARALDPGNYPSEEAYYLLNGELFREGHELGVAGAAEESDRLVSECLSRDATSVPCHRLRVMLYLSLPPTNERFMQAEASLETLRAVLPGPDEQVEAQFVALRLLSGDEPGALAAMDVYLKNFPNGQQAANFRELEQELSK